MLLTAVAARADLAEVDHWVPAFSVQLGLLGQKAEGDIASGNVTGPPLPAGCTTPSQPGGSGALCPASDPKLRPDDGSHDTMVAPLVGGAIELTTPRLVEGWLDPRVFAHVDLTASFGDERKLAGEFSPDDFGIPALDPAASATDAIVAGQGSRLFAQVEPLVVSAGLGVAFRVSIAERSVRIKPSIEYLREQIELKGVLHRAVQLRVPARTLADFRLISLIEKSTQTYHGLGPGLELETDAGRLGPLRLSVYAAGRGYRFLGSTKKTLNASNASGESVSFRFEKEPWAWRGSVGLRFRLIRE